MNTFDLENLSARFFFWYSIAYTETSLVKLYIEPNWKEILVYSLLLYSVTNGWLILFKIMDWSEINSQFFFFFWSKRLIFSIHLLYVISYRAKVD